MITKVLTATSKLFTLLAVACCVLGLLSSDMAKGNSIPVTFACTDSICRGTCPDSAFGLNFCSDSACGSTLTGDGCPRSTTCSCVNDAMLEDVIGFTCKCQ